MKILRATVLSSMLLPGLALAPLIPSFWILVPRASSASASKLSTRQVSSEGGTEPLWARNGKQLFFRMQNQMWVVDIKTGGGFATSKPRLESHFGPRLSEHQPG